MKVVQGSNISRELTKTELDAIIRAHFQTTEYSKELLAGGMFNTTYLITLVQNRRVVLRVGPVRRELLLSFEDNPMAAGRHVYERCRDVGVPAPEVLACDTTRQILDRDYMIVEYVSGKPLSSLGLDSAQKRTLHSEAGTFARKMHELTNEQFGRVADIERSTGFAKWSDCLLAEIDDFIRKAGQTKIFRPRQLRAARAIFVQNAALLDEITVPRLVHADLWEGNLLAENGHITAVLDGDRTIYGDPDFEVAGGWLDWDAFWEGYGSPPPHEPARKARQKSYGLLFRLEDAYIVTVQHRNKKRGKWHKQQALRIMKDLR